VAVVPDAVIPAIPLGIAYEIAYQIACPQNEAHFLFADRVGQIVRVNHAAAFLHHKLPYI
jgi:hypothetical protein